MSLDHELTRGKDQVWVMGSKIDFPWWFAIHSYIVTADENNEVYRWELWKLQDVSKPSWGHVHRDLFEPDEGVNIFPHKLYPRWTPFEIGYQEGERISIAKRMIDFIQEQAPSYIYAHEYVAFPGPNSNTFVQWFLDNFPHAGIKLPVTAIGKDYKRKPLIKR